MVTKPASTIFPLMRLTKQCIRRALLVNRSWRIPCGRTEPEHTTRELNGKLIETGTFPDTFWARVTFRTRVSSGSVLGIGQSSKKDYRQPRIIAPLPRTSVFKK